MTVHAPWLAYRKMPVSFKSHFLDSGSFSLHQESFKWAKKNRCDRMQFYSSDAVLTYLKEYCLFIQQYKAAIDHYSVVDVIGDPQHTLLHQSVMEEQYELKPVPCVHYKTDLMWLDHYIRKGHKYISIGGLVGNHNQDVCRDWIDSVFRRIADKNGKPKIKLHGFGVTSWELMVRFPWYSVDSATWVKRGQFGGIFVPQRTRGRWNFKVQPRIFTTAMESPDRNRKGKHFLTVTSIEKQDVIDWLDRIEVPIGKMSLSGEITEVGVINDHSSRMTANMIFFEQVAGSLPEYPWSYRSTKPRGFGVKL